MLATLLIMSLPVLLLSLWAYRSRLALARSKAKLAVRLIAVVYLGSVVYRLIGYEGEAQQLQVVGIAFAALGAIWLMAWAFTRAVAKRG